VLTGQGEGAPVPVTAIVLTQDEEANLPACLESLTGLGSDVFVVDSGSKDRTVEIARAAGATVVSHPFEHYAAQRNWAQHELPIQTEWVLHLDADERLTPALVDEINRLLAQNQTGVDGFLLRKRTVFMGRWIKHGGQYPSYHLRLFRKDGGRCEDRLYDQHFLVDGPVRLLQHDYVDVLTSDLTTWTTRHARWAELEAREMGENDEGRARVLARLFGNPIQRKRWLRQGPYRRAPRVWRAFLYWLYRYVVRRGFLDGTEGFIFHFLQGFWFRFLVDARLYETRQSSTTSACSSSLESADRYTRYCLADPLLTQGNDKGGLTVDDD
jgi:glycosyltransferase involved in cell wall biosynthesis